MKSLVIIRPQPGCDETVSAAQKLGLECSGFPLFEIQPQPWEPPDPETLDALLIGSANALRHGGAALAVYRDMPAYAVGTRTAQACAKAGLNVVATGEGGLQDLMERLDPAHRRLLRLTGSVRVEVNAPDGVTIRECVVYSSNPVPMPVPLADLLGRPTVVALHSAQAARHFRHQCSERKIDLSHIAIATIGPRVAEAAGEGWLAVGVAPEPSDKALLALAKQMCKERPRSPPEEHSARQGPMQDQTPIHTMAGTRPFRRSASGQIMVAALAFVLGAAAVAWSAWRGYLDPLLPEGVASQQAEATDAAEAPPADEAADSSESRKSQLEAVSTVEARLAMLEDRFSRLDLQANAASGNAARAESLLIAFAARRMIDRGEPLRYLADQLKLRFANAQPRAVRTTVEFAKDPVTLDELTARLEALGPQLSRPAEEENFWDSAIRDLSNLFTVRRESSSVMSSEARLERARVMLRAGRVPEAVAEVKRLANANLAAKWIDDATRYAEVQRALDLLETAAMLEPTRLQDAEGNRVDQPSPLATPTGTPDAKKPG